MLSIHPKSVQILSRDYFELHNLHRDHLGSSTVVTDENGDVIENTTYSPFGEVVSGGEVSRYGYTGKEFDPVTGDYDFNARKYKAETVQFTQPDTLLPNVYDPQQLNRYAYVRNNPYTFSDTDGHRIIAKVENYYGSNFIAVYQDDVYLGRVTNEIRQTVSYPSTLGGPNIDVTYYDYAVQKGSSTTGTREMAEAFHGTEKLSDIAFKDRKRWLKQENLEWGEAAVYDVAGVFGKAFNSAQLLGNFGRAKSTFSGVADSNVGHFVGVLPFPGASLISNWITSNAGYEPYAQIINFGGSSSRGTVIGTIGESNVVATGSGSVQTTWGDNGVGTGGWYCSAGCD